MERDRPSRRLLPLWAIPALWIVTSACPDDVPIVDAPADSAVNAASQSYDDFVQQFMVSPCDSIMAPFDNEVHDCQRLVVDTAQAPGSQPAFGPLMGILPDAETVQLDADQYAIPRVAARIVDAGTDAGNAGYEPLGIPDTGATPTAPASYCLWLRSDRSQNSWQAAIAPTQNPGESQCGDQPGDSEWRSLTVVRQVRAGATDTDYPLTARWQWTGAPMPTERSHQHYIGVRCGEGWCAIGRNGFTPVPIPDAAAEPLVQRAIFGWYDAQHLAVWRPVPGGDSILAPGPWGTVYPEWAIPPDSTSNWLSYKAVGDFVLRPGYLEGIGRYANKLNAIPPVGPMSRSYVELRLQTMPSGPVLARYGNSNGNFADATDVLVSSIPHGPARAARWRWHEADETAWVPCPIYGCCDVQPAF